MSNFLEAEFDSEEDEDYNPTAKEEAEADAVLKQLESGPIEGDEKKISNKEIFDPEVVKHWDEWLESMQPKKSVFAPLEEDEDESAGASSLEAKPSEDGKDRKRKIVEVYDFFGESVTREREVDEKEAKRIEERKLKAAERAPKTMRIGGIDALMKKIDKNPKMSVVEKSNLDWQRHVKKQKLEDDLTKYDRSKDSFLDKAVFSQNVAHAEYLSQKK